MGDRIIKKRADQMVDGETWLGWSADPDWVAPQDPHDPAYVRRSRVWPPLFVASVRSAQIYVDTQDEWHATHAPLTVAERSLMLDGPQPRTGDLPARHGVPTDTEVVAALSTYWRLLDGLPPEDGHPITYVDTGGDLGWNHPVLGTVRVSMAEASEAWRRELRRRTDASDAAHRPMDIERQPAIPEDL